MKRICYHDQVIGIECSTFIAVKRFHSVYNIYSNQQFLLQILNITNENVPDK